METRERMQIPRQAMPEQDPARRRRNFEEVPLGFSEEVAVREARRCLKCRKPLCVQGCPVNIDIPAFIAQIEQGRFAEAAAKLKEQNSLPAVTGRVCPQESQCECRCVVGKKGEPVSIGRLERFAADFERRKGEAAPPPVAAPTGFRVAVVGSGPAGLTVAGDLAKLGHRVTVFEALHEPGGVLTYGIPEFRLPKEIVQYEVHGLERLGVEIRTDFIVGKTQTIDELLANGYDAVFVGSGAGLPMFLGIPGENLVGVYSANEYLTRSNLLRSFRFPEFGTSPIRSRHVVVVGGGNVAMDAARTAIRGGARCTVVYRRGREEMPARAEEIHHAEQEGVEFRLLTNPVRVLGNEQERVAGLECVRMELGEPDESGRRRPVPVKGSEFVLECDTVVPSLGNRPNPLIPQTTPDLKTTRHGTVVVSEETFETSKPGVFAGGDIVSGAATVILAMGQGKVAARSIDRYLRSPDRRRPATG